MKACNWKITTEEWITDTERVDIIIRGKPNFIAVIENKIDAREGTDQLQRYNDWLTSQPCRDKYLIFLTPDGRPPEFIKGDHKCLSLSYDKHIKEWIRASLRDVHAMNLKVILEHYLQTIENL